MGLMPAIRGIERRVSCGPVVPAGQLLTTERRLHPHTDHPAIVMYRILDNAVQVVSFSEARESFKAVLDRVEADADVTLITRRHAKGAVVMSLDTYNSLMETVHLLRSPANAAHLQRSLEQAGRGELLSHGLIDPDPADAGD
jgi:antitoxin YefM